MLEVGPILEKVEEVADFLEEIKFLEGQVAQEADDAES